MPLPGSPEWHARVALMLAEEATQPEEWWFMSFVKDGKFAGACVIRARGVASAMRNSHALGCNPGGEIMYFPVGDGPQPYPTNRLLSRAELGKAETVGELEDRGVLPGVNVGFIN